MKPIHPIHPVSDIQQAKVEPPEPGETIPEAVKALLEAPGVYLGHSVKHTGQCVLISIGGKVYSTMPDEELDPAKFLEGDYITGPFKVDTKSAQDEPRDLDPENPTGLFQVKEDEEHAGLEAVKFLAYAAHRGQYRRDGVTPYIEHPRAVAELVRGDELAEMTAWLHDVLEDTSLTARELTELGIHPEVVLAVRYLTKKHDEAYGVYIDAISRNHLARKVKIADMLSNLADDPTDKQKIKYGQALETLEYDPRNGDPLPPAALKGGE